MQRIKKNETDLNVLIQKYEKGILLIKFYNVKKTDRKNYSFNNFHFRIAVMLSSQSNKATENTITNVF